MSLQKSLQKARALVTQLPYNLTLDTAQRQNTLAASVSTSGAGLHTGVPVTLQLGPAPANTGLVFRRTDLEGFKVEARSANLARVSYATSLMKRGVLISTTEHLLSALAACQIDNAYLEIDNLEVPILDGSALPFVQLIRQAGVRRQRARRVYAKVLKAIEISEGAKRIAVYPAEAFRVTYHIEFAHPLIGSQAYIYGQPAANAQPCACAQVPVGLPTRSGAAPYNGNGAVSASGRTPKHLRGRAGLNSGGESVCQYAAAIAPARTFGFLRDVEALRQNGLVRGGSLANAVVIGEDKVLNPEGLRFPDEFCRHKILDLIGDLVLFGHPLIGHVVVERGGHALHAALVSRLLAEKDAWTLTTLPEAEVPVSAAEPVLARVAGAEAI
jgi:UDP-3-O-[3-hydroxymyristoyl] N-acetylglucosamine deacetylase